MFDRSLYLRAADSLRGNEAQWEAYNSTGHCVVLAGPGSGKTKTLTIKLARLLSEDIQEPRGLACITYNNECARELEQRLQLLNVEPSRRVFIGTVHSFSLTQIILPYAKVANLGLPDEFSVASRTQQAVALENAVDGLKWRGNAQEYRFGMDRYRRSTLDRSLPEWRTNDPETCQLAEAYESELRRMGLIDFEDMPILAVRALREHEWIQRALVAKYPVLAVDEYQDLGRALHRMVLGLCFRSGMRLFAVGDADQSIYGFVGASPELLQRISERPDVQTVRLSLNYRCGTQIIKASEYALGEARGYQAPTGAEQGTIYFHPGYGKYPYQANALFSDTVPTIMKLLPGIQIGEIAILYPAAWIGDAVASAAAQHGYRFIRTDTNALYPRSSPLMRWLEMCAVWCSGGWQRGNPRFQSLISYGRRLFYEGLQSDEAQQAFQRSLLGVLWKRRDSNLDLMTWLSDLNSELMKPLLGACRTLNDEEVILNAFMERLGDDGDLSDMTLGTFAAVGDVNDRITLSTLHSAKGREFTVVVLFGMDEGRIPRAHASSNDIKEARRLFYVGLTRAKSQVHIVYSAASPSRFVREVRERLEDPNS